MDLEETKKIIQNYIKADESAREVRSQIKSYIDQKQNLREGFTETFKPLIETSKAVKESIDTQQNKLIKQLQDNQLALTEGLDKNRLAITSGFDKMDEVKKWDLQQLPGYEAIEEPEEPEEPEEDDETFYRISFNNIYRLRGQESRIKENEEQIYKIKESYLEELLTDKRFNKEKYEIVINPNTNLVNVIEKKKTKITTVKYEKDEMDKYLNNKESIDLLNFYGLKLPSEYKGESLEELEKAFKKGMEKTANLKKSVKNVAEYKTDTLTGLILAFPIKGEQAKDKSKELIKQYNIMQIFINNVGHLRNYKKITGQRIIHFNNPQQLVNRLELLAGSIFAGNNGVKQEFSQFAHLLHQLKVITKKQLNDLLKKYILFK